MIKLVQQHHRYYKVNMASASWRKSEQGQRNSFGNDAGLICKAWLCNSTDAEIPSYHTRYHYLWLVQF